MHFNDETCKSVVRPLLPKLSPSDYTTPVFIWSVLELSLAVIAACLPTLRPLFLRYKDRTSTRGSSTTPYKISRYGRSRYLRSGSEHNNDSGYEIPVIQHLTPAVHTRIESSDLESTALPKEGVIEVQHSFERV